MVSSQPLDDACRGSAVDVGSSDHGDRRPGDHAGRGAADPADCAGEGQEAFSVGDTGKVTKIELWRASGPQKKTVLSGLTSGAGPVETLAGGSNGAAQWGNDTHVSVGETPEISPRGVGKSASALRFTGGKLTRTTDLLAYELKANPDGQVTWWRRPAYAPPTRCRCPAGSPPGTAAST